MPDALVKRGQFVNFMLTRGTNPATATEAHSTIILAYFTNEIGSHRQLVRFASSILSLSIRGSMALALDRIRVR